MVGKEKVSRGQGLKDSREKIKGKKPLAISGQRLAISCQQQENKKGRRQGFKVSRVKEKIDSGTELKFLNKESKIKNDEVIWSYGNFYTPFCKSSFCILVFSLDTLRP